MGEDGLRVRHIREVRTSAGCACTTGPRRSRVRRVVLDARNARMGGAIAFVDELVPHLTRYLGPGTRLEVVAGPTSSWRERVRRALLFNTADAILHAGNRGGLSLAPIRVVCVRDRLLLPGAEFGSRVSGRLALRRVALALALVRATRVVVPTPSMVAPLGRVLRFARPFRPPPVQVVPHGRPSWKVSEKLPPNGPIQLLFPSHVGPHKNFLLLARILERSDLAGRCSLTLTANDSDCINGRPLREVFARARVPITFSGPVSRGELPDLYRRHDALLFPSLAESFGQPLVEAMTMGLPVVVSDRSWAHDVCGDAALFADPHNPGVWAALLNKLPCRFAELQERGRRRAEVFSWERTAEGYARLLG